MRARVALVMAFLAGCGEVANESVEGWQDCDARHRPPPPALENGGFRLSIREHSQGPGRRVEIEPDGSVTGHGWGTLWSCAGVASDLEIDAVADALNDADVLRACTVTTSCADTPLYSISVEGTSGDASGWINTFDFEECSDESPWLHAFLEPAFAPIERLSQAGCTGCPVESAAGECYGQEAGVVRICDGQSERVCDAAGAGAIVDCSNGGWYGTSWECEPSLGWVPATLLSVEQATVTRTPDAGTGIAQVDVTMDILVDNRGAAPIELSQLLPWLVYLDDNGVPMPLVVAEQGDYACSVSIVGVEGHTMDSHGFLYGCGTDPGSPVLSVPSMSVRIPERPYAASSLRPAVPVTLVDGPP